MRHRLRDNGRPTSPPAPEASWPTSCALDPAGRAVCDRIGRRKDRGPGREPLYPGGGEGDLDLHERVRLAWEPLSRDGHDRVAALHPQEVPPGDHRAGGLQHRAGVRGGWRGGGRAMKPFPRPSIRRAVIVVPSLFTLFNLFFGIWSMVLASRGDFS